jgi:hypothetical protein
MGAGALSLLAALLLLPADMALRIGSNGLTAAVFSMRTGPAGSGSGINGSGIRGSTGTGSAPIFGKGIGVALATGLEAAPSSPLRRLKAAATLAWICSDFGASAALMA